MDFNGPLRVHSRNSRYFTDESGKAIYLTGSHTWSNLQEYESDRPFDYDAYLDWLQRLEFNFTILHQWLSSTQARWIHGWSENAVIVQPSFYKQVDTNKKGFPVYDLTKFNQEYFDRLRGRVVKAMDHKIYVDINFFTGWVDHGPVGWRGHPFNKENNINGIDGDPEDNGNGLKVQTLEISAITRLQEVFCQKVIDTVNDLDNIIFQLSGESDATSTEWQYHMINYIHEYEKKKTKQHPVGMIYQWSPFTKGTNENLFQSPADWIAPNPKAEGLYNYCYNPPPADGRKVVILDTDHLWGIGGDGAWVWKSFLRGHNPIFMDTYDSGWVGYLDPYDTILIGEGKISPVWESARKAMGYSRMFAERINLAEMTPHPELTYTGYCLANPGVEYLFYFPSEFMKIGQIDLTGAKGELSVEWFNPKTGVSVVAESITGGNKKHFTIPFEADAVLYIKSTNKIHKELQ